MEQATYPADIETEIEAEYELEHSVNCPCCKSSLQTLHVVRLLRTRVNFTSNLPRRGYVMVCPSCRTLLSANVGSRVGL